MGENLTVSSNSDKTLFEAGKDIVIDRDATLNSEKNSVVFSAGQDIKTLRFMEKDLNSML